MLILSWGDWLKNSENNFIKEVSKCMEIENNFHWYRRIGTVSFFVLLQVLMLIINQDSDGRRAGGYQSLGYILLLIVPIYYGFVFYMRNKNFNRNIFLCKQTIISYYRHKAILKDEKIEQVNIDLSSIKIIVWSPFDRTRKVDKEMKGVKSFFQEVLNQIVLLPFDIFWTLVKFCYYIINGFSLKYMFKNLLIITDTEELIIPIKSQKDYEAINAYFQHYNINISSLSSTFLANCYYVKD